MKLLFSELRKLWGQRIFSLSLMVLVAVNLLFLYMSTKPGKGRISAQAYRAVSADLLTLSTEEQQQLIQEKMDLVHGVWRVEQLLIDGAENPERLQQLRKEYVDVFAQYEDTYRQRTYTLYTDQLETDYALLRQIQAELDTVANYSTFLDEVQVKANQLSAISIFQNRGSDYNQKNIEKTAQAYAGMEKVNIQYVPQKGLFTALDYKGTDLILMASMLLIASLLVRQERENGMLDVVRSTPGGRLKTGWAKLLALAISMLVVVVLMYGINLAYCNVTFGLGSLHRSIQSVPALMRCTMQITIGQYLIRFLLAKWAASFVMGLWVMFIMLWAHHVVAGWIAALALPLIQWIVRMVIPAASLWNVIKYANLASLMCTNELLGSYRNLYWFGSPVRMPAVEWTTGLLYAALLISGFCLLFCCGELRPQPVFSGFFSRKAKTKSTTVLRQEMRKLYLLGGALVVMVVFAGYQTWQSVQKESYLNANGIYYAAYMKQLEGPYTEETYQKIKNMQREFIPMLELEKSYRQHEISSDSYYDQMTSYYGLLEKWEVFQNIIYGNVAYIKENPEAYLVYENGWERLFGFHDDDDLQEVLWAGLLSCICFAGLFAFEKKGGMQHVITTTPLGRRHTVLCKLLAGGIGAGAICLLTYIPRIIVVLRDYGLGQFFAPAMSLQQFHKLPDWILLGGILLWEFCGRLIACLSMMLVILWLSDRLGNVLQTVLVSSLFWCLPPMLALSGMTNLR